ncbi:sigma 54-interacting transcriptional regulator, partial [Brevibacillus sp. H7]|uniref:sigma 54-interacting transcriptional regulator n=1 Tax=Brevibacillus sp. H7 TaxID=3349138 RepID=UPI0037F7E720
LQTDGRLLLSIPGIAVVTAAEAYAEMGDVSQYENPHQIIKKAGTNPVVIQSGGGKGYYGAISKQGNEHLRYVVYTAGKCLSLHNTELRPFYERLKEKGKHARKIHIAMGKPLEMQVKLLRVLQEKKYYPVGGTKQIEADFRVVAATNKNLEEMIRDGKFREDLYYRLNVVTLAIPPLRHRIEDTVELAHFFLYEFSLRYNRPIHAISQNVMQNLLQYDWPGNIRELRNAIERLVVFATDGIIKEEDLPYSLQTKAKQSPVQLPDDLFSLQEELEAHERRVIQRAIELENGNKQAAAKRLGISRATLYNKLNKQS